MKIIDYKRLEDCHDGTRKYEVLLDGKTDENFFKKFIHMGEFIKDEKYGKPFYKIDKRGDFAIKGYPGDNIIKIYLNQPDKKIEEYLKLID
ncbi:MAG: hypothetical protein WC002_01025 [Candidatus Muiribacteriota bacterium]